MKADRATWNYCILVVIILAIFCFNKYVIVQSTQSSPACLTLSDLSSTYIRAKQITLKNYVGNTLVNEYVLSFEDEFSTSESRKYKLPQILDGDVEVVVKLERPIRNTIIQKYDAGELYFNGLLLYFDDKTNDNKYVYFISGKNTVCYYDTENYMQEWITTKDYPKPKKFFLRDALGDFFDDSWKNNKFRKSSER